MNRPIQWEESMSVGDEQLDREHRELVDIVNQIGESITSGTSREHGALINQLLNLTRNHFHNEEQELARTGYPEVESHTREHQRLMERIVTLLRNDNRDGISPQLLVQVREWVIDHFLDHDRSYASFLKDRRRQ